MTDDGVVGLVEIRAAAHRIDGRVRRTPVLPTSFGHSSVPLLLKAENLQVTGSFKARGATAAVSLLDTEQLAHGVVTHSSGNHAQAVARAAREAGTTATIVMPEGTAEVKRRATAAYGARIEVVPPADRARRAAEIAEEIGAALVPPFDDLVVIAGQGTVGLEILEQTAELTSVWVPVGGGGLISGVAAAVKAALPHVQVFGVEPELAADLAEGFAAGHRVTWTPEQTGRTIADGLRVPAVGEHPWRHIERLVDDVVTVSEDAIFGAMRRLLRETRVIIEPSGAVALAGFLEHHGRAHSGPAVAIVSGGNADPALLARLLTESS